MSDEAMPSALVMQRANEQALVRTRVYDEAQVALLVDAWARTTTSKESPRRTDLLRDKAREVLSFFDWLQKHPLAVTPLDVQAWERHLERTPTQRGRGRSHAATYHTISMLSSWYCWIASQPEFASIANPVCLVRPKAPKPYQSKHTKALTDTELRAVCQAIQACAVSERLEEQLSALRDYAILWLLVLTGLRRREVVQLRREHLSREGTTLVISTETKGGTHRTLEVTDPSAWEMIERYLTATNRQWSTLLPEAPLWLAHDRATTIVAERKARHSLKQQGRAPGDPLTAHGFAKNLKRYALTAGLASIHVHQTRHTFARIIAEEAGSLYEVMEELGHKDLATTKVYIDKVARKKDRFSRRIAARVNEAS